MNCIRLFYFDTNAIVKYYIMEKGTKVVQAIVDGSVDGTRNVSVTSRTGLVEVCKVLQKKLNLPKLHPQKISDQEYRRAALMITHDVPLKFRPLEAEVQYANKPHSYRKIMAKHKIREPDARHVVFVLNYLANLAFPSGPIIVSSDKKHILRVFERKDHQTLDPEKETISDLEKKVGGHLD